MFIFSYSNKQMERPLIKFNQPNAIVYIICNGHAVCGIIVDVFHGKAEAGHFVHRFAVIIIPAIIAPEVETPDCRIVLLDAGKLGHVGRCLFMAHVDAVMVLLPKDTVFEFGKETWPY